MIKISEPQKLINVVLDLETLGTSEDAAIIQIGAAVPAFDYHKLLNPTHAFFEVTVSYEQALKSEFSKDSSTLDWWEKQNIPARNSVFSGQETYADAFDLFSLWINSLREDGYEIAMWGNGSDFDNRLLNYSLSAYNIRNLWSYRNNRDLRTLRALFPIDYLPRLPHELEHTGLGDAMYEARVLSRIVHEYRGMPVSFRGIL